MNRPSSVAGPAFDVMVATERVAAVVPAATVPGVGEHRVVLLVVANPGAAALGLRQVLRLSTRTASRPTRRGGLPELAQLLLRGHESIPFGLVQ